MAIYTLFGHIRGAILALTLASFTILAGCNAASGDKDVAAAAGCPEGLGWAEGLPAYFSPDATLPVAFSADADDCLFQQWSWEAFAWATAEIDGKPRFMSLKTMEMLDSDSAAASKGTLRLTPRSTKAHNLTSEEYAAAFDEADGSVLVAQNGYPVYASIHMNDSYFATAKANLIVTGDYKNNADADQPGVAPADCGELGDAEAANNAYFSCGAAVFKATWLRLKDGEAAPDGAYTTTAEVPVLKNLCTKTSCTVVATDQFVSVQVALVGLHVVGYVEHHPEFLWATFEHSRNAPAFEDGTFSWDADNGACGAGYTFCAEGTAINQKNVLVPNQPDDAGDPPLLTFDEVSQTFAPITQVIQMNRTGGTNQANGAQNIDAVNQASRETFKTAKSKFADYFLVGTVWLAPDTYVAGSPNIANTDGSFWQNQAVGGLALANTTAETFMQSPGKGDTMNCFACHNPQSYYTQDKTSMPLRRIAISHALAVDTPFAVPNAVPGKIPGTAAPGTAAKAKK